MADLVTVMKSPQGAFSYLHPGLHHIQRRISKDTGSSRCRSEHRRDNRVHFSPGVVTLEAESKSRIHGEWKEIGENASISCTERRTKPCQRRTRALDFVLLSHLCTNCAASSSRRIGWPDWFLVSAQSLSDLDTFPSHLNESNR